jgi:hypothetical protein
MIVHIQRVASSFVTVSQKFDLKAILRDILEQLIPHGPNQYVNSDRDLQGEQLSHPEISNFRM